MLFSFTITGESFVWFKWTNYLYIKCVYTESTFVLELSGIKYKKYSLFSLIIYNEDLFHLLLYITHNHKKKVNSLENIDYDVTLTDFIAN